MADYTRVLELIEELRERIGQLTAEVRQLQHVEADRSATPSALRSAGGAPPAVEEDSFDLSKVIPPTRTTEPESIIGGRLTRDFPDCCAIGDGTRYFCSGTLIAPNLVVTAKHCREVERVFLKGHNVARPETGETIAVSNQFEHAQADIRVLVLERASTVSPRHIAQGQEVRATRALLVGFGNVDAEGSVGYGRKRRVEVPITSLGCTTQDDVANFGCREGIEMVAGHRGLAKDSCTGDSGGPLYIEGPTGQYYLLGVTSRGITPSPNTCGDGGIYVRVDQFVDWIQTQTGITLEGARI